MNLYMIYYRRNATLRENADITYEAITKSDDYVLVTPLMGLNLEDIFEKMQGEHWSPNGEARPFIESLDLDHTSMSVGDCVLDVSTGNMYECASEGWNKVNRIQ